MINRKLGLWGSDPFLLLHIQLFISYCSEAAGAWGAGGVLKVSGSHTRPAESGSPALGPSNGSLFLTNLPGHFYACGCGATLWGTSLQEFYAAVLRIFVSSLAYEDRSICRILGAERKQSVPLWTHYAEIAGVVHKQNHPGTRRKGWRGSLRGPPPRASPLGQQISSLARDCPSCPQKEGRVQVTEANWKGSMQKQHILGLFWFRFVFFFFLLFVLFRLLFLHGTKGEKKEKQDYTSPLS